MVCGHQVGITEDVAILGMVVRRDVMWGMGVAIRAISIFLHFVQHLIAILVKEGAK